MSLRRTERQCRPHLEPLEDRLAPAATILLLDEAFTVSPRGTGGSLGPTQISQQAGADGHGLSIAEVHTHGVIDWHPGK